MDRPVIVLARELPEAFVRLLESCGEWRMGGRDAASAAFEGARVYVSTAVDPVPGELIAALPDTVGLIANFGVGTDNIDLAAAARRGIAVSNTPVVTEDTADLAMALLLSTCRRLSVNERVLRAGQWSGGLFNLHNGVRVHGKALGIVGFGAIGQAVARRARGFGMPILYHGPHRKPEAEAELGARYCPELHSLLAEADIVSLNCALTPETRHLIDAAALAQMKPGAVLINTGRGPLVEESALVQALRSGRLGGAGLDVFEFEPAVAPALLELPNVTLLPHIGSATDECRIDMALRVVHNITQFLSGGGVPDRVA
jgi:glyoxylate reductase